MEDVYQLQMNTPPLFSFGLTSRQSYSSTLTVSMNILPNVFHFSSE